MNKLKEVVKEYDRWNNISIYINRIETYIDIDFSLSVENAKSLLESIGKQICIDNKMELGSSPSVNAVLRKAFISIGYKKDDLVNQISSALSTIGQQVGNLRNDIGLTSHGKSLEEIEGRNNQVEILTKEFLIDTVELVSVFLIRNVESKLEKSFSESLGDTVEYLEAEQFNEYLDDSFGVFEMGVYSYPASEILFNVDKQAYLNEYKVYNDE